MSKPVIPKKYLIVSAVARWLGVTPLTVRNWDKKRRLIAYRHPVNNYRIYKIEDVKALLKRIEEPRPKEKPLDYSNQIRRLK
ncbi:MAG: hypothetical protein A3D92_25125, partial [Bacteroidetes bacterium RIFCSPHIGHO2_02_FULL_44_7]